MSETASVPCPICRTHPTWKNVDHFRTKPGGMALCTSCGFITYPDRIARKDEILKHYEEEYRKAPTVDNVFTGQRKNQYHGAFLASVFEKWKEEGNDTPVATDIGSAFGFFLQWLRAGFPRADLYGVELTKGFVRNAWHEFQIKSLPEFDASKKYDLISSYKSLEHIVDPDVELHRYIACLKDDGFLYLGVPIWFEVAKNFGMGNFTLDYYYDPAHINVWSRRHVEGLIKACGGEIVKENRTMYDTVYLIQKAATSLLAPGSERQACYVDPLEVEKNMNALFVAHDCFEAQKVDEAIAAWPNYPQAWVTKYEMGRQYYHSLGLDGIMAELINPMIEACPGDADIHFVAGDIFLRYEAFDLALKNFDLANRLKPNQANVLMKTADCYRMVAKRSKDPNEKIELIKMARDATRLARNFDASVYREATTLIMQDNAYLPTPFEGKA